MAVQESVVPAVRRQRRRTKPVMGVERRAPIQPALPSALESMFRLITEPVLKLETTPNGPGTLREIGILLGDVLDLLEEDQSITRAADRLYEAAFALQDAQQHQHSCRKFNQRVITARAEAVHAPLAALRQSLGAAKPNARARAQRLTW